MNGSMRLATDVQSLLLVTPKEVYLLAMLPEFLLKVKKVGDKLLRFTTFAKN